MQRIQQSGRVRREREGSRRVVDVQVQNFGYTRRQSTQLPVETCRRQWPLVVSSRVHHQDKWCVFDERQARCCLDGGGRRETGAPFQSGASASSSEHLQVIRKVRSSPPEVADLRWKARLQAPPSDWTQPAFPASTTNPSSPAQQQQHSINTFGSFSYPPNAVVLISLMDRGARAVSCLLHFSGVAV